MNQATFDFLWQHGIKQTIDGIYSSLCSTLSPFEIQKYQPFKKIPEKRVVFDAYLNYNQFIKRHYFDNGTSGTNLIDSHKICACLSGALLYNHSIFYRAYPDVPRELFLSNYLITFLAGTKCLYYLKLSQLQRDGNMNRYSLLSKQKQFIYPATNPGHDKYILGKIKSLALLQYMKNHFDVLSYADMLFWIEKFNIDSL